MEDKILATVKSKNKVKTLELTIKNFGTVDLGLAQVPIKEVDVWLRILYGYKLLSVKFKDHTVKFY